MATDDGHIVFEDAHILFKNFAGAETKYNREGDRNFCVIIPEDIAPKLLDDGWNVKVLEGREEGDAARFYMKVSVSFKGRPPMLVMISSRGRTNLSQTEVEMLDWVDIKMVDLIVRPYHWTVKGETGVSAYLKSMFVTINEDELERKYADIPDAGRYED